MTEVAATLGLRARLAERVSVAYSSDGRDIGFAGPVELGVEVGGLAMIDVPDGGHLVVQLRDLRVVEVEGLSFDVDVSDVVPGAASATVRPRFRSLSGSAAVLGHFDADGFNAFAATTPFGELPIRPAESDEVEAIVNARAARPDRRPSHSGRRVHGADDVGDPDLTHHPPRADPVP